MKDSSSFTNTTAVIAAVSTVLVTTAAGTLWRIKAKAQETVNQPIFPGIPYAPGGHWLLGHLILLNSGGNFVQGYKLVYEDNADPETGLCSMWFATQPAVSVLLGHHVKAVLMFSYQALSLLDQARYRALAAFAFAAAGSVNRRRQ